MNEGTDAGQGEACALDDEGRASLRRLSELSQRLSDMSQSGELTADLFRIAQLNPMRHGDRTLLAREADVITKVAMRARTPRADLRASRSRSRLPRRPRARRVRDHREPRGANDAARPLPQRETRARPRRLAGATHASKGASRSPTSNAMHLLDRLSSLETRRPSTVGVMRPTSDRP